MVSSGHSHISDYVAITFQSAHESNSKRASSPIPKTAPVADNNSLDFRSPDDLLGSITSPSEARSQLAASIQPQRRGRPSRGAGVPEASSQPTQAPSVKPPTIRVQVTGEDAAPLSKRTAASGQASNVVEEVKNASAALIEAFGPTTSETSSRNKVEPGFDDGFDGTRFAPPKADPLVKAKTIAAPERKSARLSAGFGDAFTPPSSDAKRVDTGSKSIDVPVSAGVRPSSALAQNAASSPTNVPQDELSFEDRFPSLEALSAQHENPRPKVMFTKSPEVTFNSLPSPELAASRSPGNSNMPRQTSFHQPSVTGGTSGEQSQNRLLNLNARPLTRSNQVTGTAFATDTVAANASKSTKPQLDLLDSILPPEPSQSVPSNRPETTGRPSFSSAVEQVEDTPNLPPRPGTSRQFSDRRISQDQPTMPANESTPSSKQVVSADWLTGNDGETSKLKYYSMTPTNQGGQAIRSKPPAAAKPARLAESTSRDSMQSQRQSSLLIDPTSPVQEAKSNLSSSSPKSAGGAAAISSASRSPEPAKPAENNMRPRSMYTAPSPPPSAGEPSSRPPISAGTGAELARTGSRPGSLTRSDSINALVSRYETISSPKQEANGFDIQQNAKTRGSTVPKPAPKPSQLRADGAQDVQEPSSGVSRSRSMYMADTRGGNTFANGPSYRKPVVAPELQSAARQQLTPEPSLDRRRSSGGSTNNAIDPKQAPSTNGNDAARAGEDVKPKSVNSLIAKWNQAAPPAPGTHPSAGRARAPIGSGRRL